MSAEPQNLAEQLNRHCRCVGTDVVALRSWLDADLKQRGLTEPIVSSHPHLFSELPVFVSHERAAQMKRVIAAIESVIQLPAYRDAVLARALEIAHVPPKARGVFLGYDFHLSSDGPKLIEINTNAGGALLNVAMTRAQQACCPEVGEYLHGQPSAAELEEVIFGMFMCEWQLSRSSQSLGCIAIVDSAPMQQYLYPEFLLFAQLFERRGVHAVIASPEQFRYEQGVVWLGNQRVDLVYNRLTDFYLQFQENHLLARAYKDDAIVLTPHPHAHALYANKHNLSILSDERTLRSYGVSDETICVLLQGVPRTLTVAPSDSEHWWSDRKHWFFKPASGFGSRGSYRGDKLTRGAFAELLRGDYVAQKIIPPSERWLADATNTALKFDVRNYVYEGQVQLMAARLYRGQTTNFRTEGGGFAPIYCL